MNFTYLENLLNVLKGGPLKKVVFCSSLAVSLLENNIVHDTARYGVLKKESEALLKSYFDETSQVEVVILRPPLVYGQNAPGNFSKLVRILSLKIPLPFGSLENKRPYIHIDNLVEIFHAVILNKLPKRITYLEVKDPFDITLSDFMIELQKKVIGKNLIFKFPPFLLSFIFLMMGKKSTFDKLVFNFSVKSESFDSIPLEKYPVSDSSCMFKDLE